MSIKIRLKDYILKIPNILFPSAFLEAVSLSNPNLNNKIEELLLSTFKNAIQKQKINGGNIILVSNFGLSDDLQTHYKKDEDGNESIDYMDCYMPAYKRSLIQDFLVEKEYKDFIDSIEVIRRNYAKNDAWNTKKGFRRNYMEW